MGGTSSVVLVPCARNAELPNGWREELQAHCRNNPQDHCALPPEGDDPDPQSEAFRGWIVSVVKNTQTSSALSEGTAKLVLLLGTGTACFDRMAVLQLCEAIRDVSRKRLLVKYVRYQELRRSIFNADEAQGLSEQADDLLAHNAWTDAPYYFFKRAENGFLAFRD
mmetsp:Transcript_1580/g.3730  ORF Transcript_1580/g.3730 Transcript_1580/m.3730 type:complete len:166 (-) Transcript_1580:20-517(-)